MPLHLALLDGALKVTGVTMTAYGAVVRDGVYNATDNPSDTQLDGLAWGGEVSGHLDVEGSDAVRRRTRQRQLLPSCVLARWNSNYQTDIISIMYGY